MPGAYGFRLRCEQCEPERTILFQDAQSPCFLSYAWGDPDDEPWVLRLAKDLRNAGIQVLLDRWNNPPGASLSVYIDRILTADFVVVICTSELQQKYRTRAADPVVAAELRKPELGLTPQIEDVVSLDCRDEPRYFRNVFDLICTIYELPPDNPLLDDLRPSLTTTSNVVRTHYG